MIWGLSDEQEIRWWQEDERQRHGSQNHGRQDEDENEEEKGVRTYVFMRRKPEPVDDPKVRKPAAKAVGRRRGLPKKEET